MRNAEFAWEQTDDECVIWGNGWRVVFERAGDRWKHHLAIGSPGEVLPKRGPAIVASSVDHDPDRHTVRPVFQELQRHALTADRAGVRCVLLTGRALEHNFSAAMTIAPDPDAPEFVVLDIDVADRCRDPFVELAATYRMRLGSEELVKADSHAIIWSGGTIGADRLELRCEAPTLVLALPEAVRKGTMVQAFQGFEAGRFTHRLRYRWRWSTANAADAATTR
jgi:hypothetical protein